MYQRLQLILRLFKDYLEVIQDEISIEDRLINLYIQFDISRCTIIIIRRLCKRCTEISVSGTSRRLSNACKLTILQLLRIQIEILKIFVTFREIRKCYQVSYTIYAWS